MQYIVGTEVRPLGLNQYDPVDFKRMQLNTLTCQFHVLQDKHGDVVFELHCENETIMAFLFSKKQSWEIKQRRDAFAKLFDWGEHAVTPIYFGVTPTEMVEELPARDWWETSSSLKETAFWASDKLCLNIGSRGTKYAEIQLGLKNGTDIGTFGIAGKESDDEDVLEAALILRKRLHMRSQIRVESSYCNHRISWYIPTALSSEKM